MQQVGPTGEASRAERWSTVCLLCGQAISTWFEARVLRAADGRQGVLRVCRGCFWRSPARSLTGWGRGVQWISPDLVDAGTESRPLPAEQKSPGAREARPDQGRRPLA